MLSTPAASATLPPAPQLHDDTAHVATAPLTRAEKADSERWRSGMRYACLACDGAPDLHFLSAHRMLLGRVRALMSHGC
jgi:hypothetical protein